MSRIAGRMVTDMITLAEGHPGVLHALNQIADVLGLDLKVALDPEFEILFPTRVKKGDWREAHEAQTKNVSRLANEWATRDPVTVLQQIERILADASGAGIAGPNQLSSLLYSLAQQIECPTVWVRAMLEVQTPGFLASPILWRAATENDPAWPALARTALDQPEWRGVIDYAVLMTPSLPADLLSTVLDRVKDYPDVVLTASIRKQIPEETLLRILQDGADEVAGAAAAGEWQAEPQGHVRESLRDAWRTAIVRCPIGENGIGEILKTDSELALRWLVSRIDSIARRNIESDQTISDALSALDVAGRRALLGSLPENFFDGRIIAKLVADDLDLYRDFLAIHRPPSQHLAPLCGASKTEDFETIPSLGNVWAEKAVMALDHGYTREGRGTATPSGRRMAWWGNESAMWDTWIGQFEAMREHPDSRIRLVAEIGRDRVVRSRDSALRRERAEAVYGHD